MGNIQIDETVVVGTGDDERLARVVGITQRADGSRFAVVPHGSKRERVVTLGEIRRLVPAIEVSTR